MMPWVVADTGQSRQGAVNQPPKMQAAGLCAETSSLFWLDPVQLQAEDQNSRTHITMPQKLRGWAAPKCTLTCPRSTCGIFVPNMLLLSHESKHPFFEAKPTRKCRASQFQSLTPLALTLWIPKQVDAQVHSLVSSLLSFSAMKISLSIDFLAIEKITTSASACQHHRIKWTND